MNKRELKKWSKNELLINKRRLNKEIADADREINVLVCDTWRIEQELASRYVTATKKS